MFQGKEEARNHAPFGFDPKEVDAVLLTHAHLDHVGRLPKLFREGYRGPVYATRATVLLMEIVLEDALKVMDEPFFGPEDVEEALGHLRPLEYGEWLRLGALSLAFGQAGHLPGSAFVVAQGEGRTLVYSGDLGNREKDVLPDPSLPPLADLVLAEGTYGDRPHRPYRETVREFLEILEKTLSQGGKVLIPTFAVERAQEILYVLYTHGHRLPRAPIYLDSPMAGRVLSLYPRLVRYFSEEVQAHFLQGKNPFRPAGLEVVEHTEASKALNRAPGPMVVLAGSGMLAGGGSSTTSSTASPTPETPSFSWATSPREGLGRRSSPAPRRADPGGRGALAGERPHPGRLLRPRRAGRASGLASGRAPRGPGPRGRGKAPRPRQAPRPPRAGGEPGALRGGRAGVGHAWSPSGSGSDQASSTSWTSSPTGTP